MIPRRLILGTKWEDSIRAATPGTTIRYGNIETESVEETTTIGDYMASLVPDRYSTALICVHDITMSGHTVIFTNTATIVEDIGGRYYIHIPRTPTSREWRTPLNLLHRPTTLCHLQPLTETLPHPDTQRQNTRDGPQHSNSRQKTPRQNGTQTSCRHVQSSQHNMATSAEYSTESPASHASSQSETETADSYGQEIAHRRNHHQRNPHNPTRPPLQRQPATQKRWAAKSARSSATTTSAQSTPPV
jgi:hypothetical protein